jgi:type II secretory pathway pseudopilin PulG
MFKKVESIKSGFTLIELLVTVGIFIFMTALVVANYGSFNDGTLLTSMSYDVALALRGAQSYGLNVKGDISDTSQNFNYPYGMDFNSNTGSNNQMIFFADSDPSNGNNSFGDGIYTPSDSLITTYTLARGGLIKCLYVSNSPITSSDSCSSTSQTDGFIVSSVDITFKRPDPNAIIMATVNGTLQKWVYAQIQVQNASKTSTRSIVVNENGLIAVQNQ